MSDKNYSLPNGENYLVRKSANGSNSVKKQPDKTATEFPLCLEKTEIDDKTTRLSYSTTTLEKKSLWIYKKNNKRILSWPGGSMEIDCQEYSENTSVAGGALKPLKLTMPGKVLSIKIQEGDIVDAGTNLLIVEAMKMENLLLAPARAKIGKIHVKEGDRLESGALLINFEAAE